MRHVVIATLLLSAAEPLVVTAFPSDRPAYRHAYYLFLAGTPTGCEDCYLPLLITQEPIEHLARRQASLDCVLITTYERDSIWEIERLVPLRPSDIQLAERIVRLRGRTYRYQEIGPAEVLRLLEAPQGTIPIARIKAPPGRDTLQDLIDAFRAVR